MKENTHILAKVAMEGNQDAFGELIAQHYPLVRGVAFRRVGDWDASEDLAQETLLAAHANLDQLRDSAAFPAWLCRIARNLSANWIRSEQYRRELAKRYKAERGTNAAMHTDASEDLARREQVHALLEKLPAKLREALVIFYLEEQTAPEAARILGIPENTFYNRVHRARRQLQELVEQDLRETLRPDTSKDVQRRLLSLLPLLPVMPVFARRAAAVGPGFTLGNVCLQTWTGVASAGGKSAFAALGFAVVAALGIAFGRGEDTPRQVTPVHVADATAGDAVALQETEDANTSPPGEGVSAAAVNAPASALSEADPALSEEPQQVGTVSGHVYRDDVVPLEGARVIVYAPGTTRDERTVDEIDEYLDPMWGSIVHPENAFHAVSDAEGIFKVTGIRNEGDARINVYHKGYVHVGANIEVIAGDEHSINFTPWREELVTGVLLSESGAPVADAKLHGVMIDCEDGGGGSGSVQAGYTDQDGVFHLPVDLKGSERAVATIMAKSETLGRALFQNVDVCPEDTITLRYARRTSLRGNVTVSSDASPSGFRVTLEGHLDEFFGSRHPLHFWNVSTEVEPDGSYAFDRLDAGPIYRVKVLDLDGKEVALNRDFLELRATPSNTVNLRVEESAWISGRVYGVQSQIPIPNVRVRCERITSPATGFTAQVDSEGNYRLEVLRGWGAFQIMADYGGDKNFERRPDRLVEELEIGPGGEYNVNLPLPTPWSRSFLVQDDLGRPITGLRARVNSSALDGSGGSDGSWREPTDAQGKVVLYPLDPGSSISVLFLEDGYSAGPAKRLAGEPGEEMPTETIVLNRIKSNAVARLVDGNNVAFANRTVNVHLYTNGDPFMMIDTKTDAEGMIRAEQRAVLSNLLPPSSEVSFELEIENPPMDGQDGVTYRSKHLLLPEDEMEDMGTIVLEPVVAGAAQ